MANHTYQTVIDAIDAILGETSLTDYTTDVIDRLFSFGYTPVTTDAFAIAFAMQKGYNHILNETNQLTIPDGLKQVFIDMMCGEFFNAMYMCGKLSLSGLDFSGIIQSVSEGDTSVSFNKEGSDDQKIQNLIGWMMSGEGSDLVCYRKIRW